jgi:hypothetical protein
VNAVHDLEQQIRDLVIGTRRRAALMKSSATWGMCCSSLDALGDTELAIEAYMHGAASSAGGDDHATGRLYIGIYGLLQALFVQQDAVENLATALLGTKCKRSEVLQSVRDVRNAASGHPTHQKGKPAAFNFIARITMFHGGFRMMTLKADGTHESTDVDVKKLVAVQSTEVRAALTSIRDALAQEEREHRAKFREQKLAACFPDWLGHTHEKIDEAIHGGPEMHEFGAGMLASLPECVKKFQEALAERGLESIDAATYLVSELEHPTSRLRAFFSSPDASLTAADAEVFHFFIKEKTRALRALAEEIDADYASEPTKT